jgi:hypothetical protein
MACFRLVTFLPLRPLLSLPVFISFISVSTFLLAAGEYLRADFFLADGFLPRVDFFVAAAMVLSSAVRWQEDFERLSRFINR